MRKSCPNYDHEDGLDTVYEVPIPEEIIISCAKNGGNNSWKSMKSWIRNSVIRSVPSIPTNLLGGSRSEIQILLGVVGAPLVPIPVPSNGSINRDIKNYPSERSMAKYIVQQYIAATGGDCALDAIDSMLAVGKVKMIASDFYSGDGYTKKEVIKAKSMRQRHQGGGGEVGSFVLWQKRPDLWSLELILSGCKMNAGSNGQVAWRQTPWQNSHASRGPPRPLRRCLQGLDPRSTANLFSNSNCIGEKAINDEDCFVLELETEASTLRARSSSNLEIIRHTILGYFSQKTGLLVKFEDSHLLRIKTAGGEDNIFWETTMESLIQDYRIIDGINIAHGGRTFVSLFRFGDSTESHSRTRMEEVWAIEDVDFNIEGLGMECFLPPSDLKKEQEGCNTEANYPHLPFRTRVVSAKIGASKVAAIDLQESDSTDDEQDGS